MQSILSLIRLAMDKKQNLYGFAPKRDNPVLVLLMIGRKN